MRHEPLRVGAVSTMPRTSGWSLSARRLSPGSDDLVGHEGERRVIDRRHQHALGSLLDPDLTHRATLTAKQAHVTLARAEQAAQQARGAHQIPSQQFAIAVLPTLGAS